LDPQACRADIIVLSRTSSAEVKGFAGAGGAGQSFNQQQSSLATSGSFSFAENFDLAVTENMAFSTGAATSTGTLSVSDHLSQATIDSLLFTGSRSAGGAVARQSGAGVATAELIQEMRVRFQVTEQAVQYQLTGFYNPGASTGRVGEISQVQLYRPFTSFSAFNISGAGPVNLTGTLNPGFIYEFRLRLTDSMGANSNNPNSADASNFNLQFRLNSVPEPSSAIFVAAPVLGCLMQRRRRQADGFNHGR
jgi:hypothetical protein